MKMNLLSERLKWAIQKKEAETNKRISNVELARVAGVSRTAPTLWMKDENGIRGNSARELAKFLNVDPVWLEEGKGDPERYATSPREIDLSDNPDYPSIRRVSLKLSAGHTGYAVEYDVEDRAPISFAKEWFDKNNYRPDKLMAVKVSGSSMEPGLFEGDSVVINTADTKPVDGRVFAINYEGEMLIKRMTRDAGMWWITSDNPDQRRYPRKECAGDSCLIIGRIVHKQSEHI